MNELFDILDEKWNLFRMILLNEDDITIRYQYIIDNCDDKESGIIEFDKETLLMIVQGEELNLSYLLKTQKIKIIKPYTGIKNFYLGEYDLSILLPLRVILKHLFIEEVFIDNKEFVNMRYIESIKDKYPQQYNRIIEIFEEVKEAERNRLS